MRTARTRLRPAELPLRLTERDPSPDASGVPRQTSLHSRDIFRSGVADASRAARALRRDRGHPRTLPVARA